MKNEEGGNTVATVVLRGSTDSILDDLERAVDDGVNTYKVWFPMLFGCGYRYKSGIRFALGANSGIEILAYILGTRIYDAGPNQVKGAASLQLQTKGLIWLSAESSIGSQKK